MRAYLYAWILDEHSCKTIDFTRELHWPLIKRCIDYLNLFYPWFLTAS